MTRRNNQLLGKRFLCRRCTENDVVSRRAPGLRVSDEAFVLAAEMKKMFLAPDDWFDRRHIWEKAAEV